MRVYKFGDVRVDFLQARGQITSPGIGLIGGGLERTSVGSESTSCIGNRHANRESLSREGVGLQLNRGPVTVKWCTRHIREVGPQM